MVVVDGGIKWRMTTSGVQFMGVKLIQTLYL
jgi:hypothetical protein